MIILVDFENTHVSGLDGYEYLNDTDTLVMYYSDENSAVTKGMVDDLKKHNVHVSLVKLLKQHSNALDMYIASTTGMFLETGEKICIVSKDKGYAAVRDFWHSLRGAEILLGETIKECFLNSEKIDDVRIKLCKERAQKATLVDSFATMNTIPTRPTLSRGNQRRKNKNINFTLVSEPVSLIPNPLMMETPADQLARQMQTAPTTEASKESSEPEKNRTSDTKKTSNRYRSDDRRTGEQTSNGLRDSSRYEDKTEQGSRNGKGSRSNNQENRKKERTSPDAERETISHGGYDGIGKVNEASRIENQKRAEAKEKTKAIIKSEPEKTAIIPRTEPKTAITKPESKFDPNRMHFIYDPVSHSMSKVGSEASEEGTKTARDDVDAVASTLPDNGSTEKTDEALRDAVTSQVESEESSDEKKTVSPDASTKEDTLSSSADDAKVIEAASDKEADGSQKETIYDFAESENVSESAAETSNHEATVPADAETSIQEAALSTDAETSTQEAALSTDAETSIQEAALSSDTELSSTDEAAISVEQPASKTPAAKKSGRKAGRPRKNAKKDSSASSQDMSDAKVADQETSSDVTEAPAATEAADNADASSVEAAEETSKAKTGKRGRKPAAKKASKKDDTGTAKKKSSKKSKAEDASASKTDQGESIKSDSQDKTGETELSPVTPEEAVNKYGLTANTLHTYYVRLMKAYGKEQGRALYDSSKKMVQEDIKRRKEK